MSELEKAMNRMSRKQPAFGKGAERNIRKKVRLNKDRDAAAARIGKSDEQGKR